MYLSILPHTQTFPLFTLMAVLNHRSLQYRKVMSQINNESNRMLSRGTQTVQKAQQKKTRPGSFKRLHEHQHVTEYYSEMVLYSASRRTVSSQECCTIYWPMYSFLITTSWWPQRITVCYVRVAQCDCRKISFRHEYTKDWEYKVKAREQQASLYYSTRTEVSALQVERTRSPIKDPPC